MPLLALLLTAISVTAVLWCSSHGYTLYYGDAEAHLNIARRILDSRTPGLEQLGTVWLPLPHLLMLPFVTRDSWWHSGLAGAIPSAASFVIAGTFLFAAARRLYLSTAAGVAAALLFALNPNMLYLQSIPMTEALFAAALAALLWATIWFRATQSMWAVLAAAVASNAASLTRYEGWFLIPFVALYFLITARRKSYALVFAALAALGPLAWLAHNQYYYSNALEFYGGEGSAKAIYAGELAAGGARYPGDHNWRLAIEYYFAAITLTQGWTLAILGSSGCGRGAGKKDLVAAAPAGPSTRILRVEHPFLRHAAVCADAVALQLVQHALRAGGSAAGRVRRRRLDRALPVKLRAAGAGLLVAGIAALVGLRRTGVLEGIRRELGRAPRLDGASRGLSRKQLPAGRWHHIFFRRSDRRAARGRHPSAGRVASGQPAQLGRCGPAPRSVFSRTVGAGDRRG